MSEIDPFLTAIKIDKTAQQEAFGGLWTSFPDSDTFQNSTSAQPKHTKINHHLPGTQR